MESKIMIDINYASRDPQIVIQQKESDDPRDKLVSMFTGHSMPGVRDGYCRIERYPEINGDAKVVITPVHPVELINHIPLIAKFAEENAASDTSEVPKRYRKIIKGESDRLKIKDEDPEMVFAQALEMVDVVCVGKLPHDLYKKWKDIMFDIPKKTS
jgi:hypothetical protein